MVMGNTEATSPFPNLGLLLDLVIEHWDMWHLETIVTVNIASHRVSRRSG